MSVPASVLVLAPTPPSWLPALAHLLPGWSVQAGPSATTADFYLAPSPISGPMPERCVVLGASSWPSNLPTPLAFFPKPIRLGAVADWLQQQAALAQHRPLNLGDFSLKRWPPSLRQGTQTQELTDKEAALLALLWQNPAHEATREQILANVWGHTTTLETHTLETHIYRLRRKLEQLAPNQELLRATKGGYQWVTVSNQSSPSSS